MKDFTVSVQIIKTYHVNVKAGDESEAAYKVTNMDTMMIAERGSLVTIDVENAEVL